MKEELRGQARELGPRPSRGQDPPAPALVSACHRPQQRHPVALNKMSRQGRKGSLGEASLPPTPGGGGPSLPAASLAASNLRVARVPSSVAH